MNRKIYSFNNTVDSVIAKPIARTYENYIPNFIKVGTKNFFDNLGMISTALNNILQLKLRKTPDDIIRVALNTTIGIGGLFDVATQIGIPRHDEDFGQTLGYWGIKSGPFLMLPLVGPSTVRDGVGRPIDAIINPKSSLINNDRTTFALTGVQIVNVRARLLDLTDIVDQQLDPYSFIREAYLNRRISLVKDLPPGRSNSGGALVPQKSLLEMEKELFGDETLENLK